MAILLLVFSTSVIAQSGSRAPFSAKVQLSVSANENIKGQIESYINRELRSLHDVVLVDEDADWELSLLALEPSVGGHKSGAIALSLVVLTPFSNGVLSGMFQEEAEDMGALVTEGLYSYPDHYLRVGPEDELREMCAGLVADFDSDLIEKRRKLIRKYSATLPAN